MGGKVGGKLKVARVDALRAAGQNEQSRGCGIRILLGVIGPAGLTGFCLGGGVLGWINQDVNSPFKI